MRSQTIRADASSGGRTRKGPPSRRTVLLRLCFVGLTVVTALPLVWSYFNTPPPLGELPISTVVSGAASDSENKPTVAEEVASGSVEPGGLLQELLHRGDYEAAVDLYARAYSGDDSHTTHQYREALLRQVSEFIQSGAYDDATTLLDTYLAVFFRDTEALVYAGRAYRENRQFRPAIEAFLRASQQDQHPDRLRMVNGQLGWTIGLYVQQLREQQRYNEIVDLYTYLTHASPQNPHYFIALARAYVAVGRTSDALAALQFVAAEDDAGRQAQELIAEIRAGL
ncbi:MAG: tetratricopeptide repeat protein [Gammaproteobacteria bacterium]|nr:tetratricopeptide repeat protein [Gammaproteobacteria bacterium]